MVANDRHHGYIVKHASGFNEIQFSKKNIKIKSYNVDSVSRGLYQTENIKVSKTNGSPSVGNKLISKVMVIYDFRVCT